MSETENSSHELAPEFTEENSHVLSSYKDELRVELTRADVRRYHSEAATLELGADEKFLQAKDAFDKAKSKWKGDTTRAKEKRQSAHRGWITRTGTVEVVAHWKTDTAYSVRRDAGYEGVVIESRSLVDGERQQPLPLPSPERSKDWWASFGQEVIRHMAEAKADGEELTADGIHSLILASEKYQDSTAVEVQRAMDKIEADTADASENGSSADPETDRPDDDSDDAEELTETKIRDLIAAFLLAFGKSGAKKIANHVREHAPETTDAQVKAAILAEIGANGCRICKDGRSYKALVADADDAQKDEREALSDDAAFRLCIEALKGANNGLSITKMAGLLNAEHTREDGGDFEAAHVKAWMNDAVKDGLKVPDLEQVTPFTFMIRI